MNRLFICISDSHLITTPSSSPFHFILIKNYSIFTKNGSPLPEFETYEAHDYFVSRFFIHDSFRNSELVSNSEENETSLKQVLKHNEYSKMLPIIEKPDQNGCVSINEAMSLTGKSRTTVWRYMKILVDAEIVETTGETNNVLYVLKK